MHRSTHAQPARSAPPLPVLFTDLPPRAGAAPDTGIGDAVWRELATALEVEVAALHAIAEVESAGRGFLPSGRPKILFEGHAFHRLTGGRFSAAHPDISYPKWDRSKYKGGEAEWTRLDKACALDRNAALQSASWGLFQIMGFNHGYCGCADVEAFVAEESRSAECQLRHFARFIARPQFIGALGTTKNWAAFAKAYNGPGYAKNKYDTKLAAAYARWSKAGAGAMPRIADAAKPPGREQFAPVLELSRRDSHRRNVQPDPADLRDWEYRPNISVAPPASLLPHDLKPVKQQGRTSACTGFALAAVIEYLLDRGRRPVWPISGYMLYHMARQYDEWADDAADTGSSLRGALKGWSKHGACCDRLWTTLERPPERATDGWCLDAIGRPMGAYYRIKPENIRDMHIALYEAGVIYASAYTHSGWDKLLHTTAALKPNTVEELLARATIPQATGKQDLGHAFAIVGYTREGFIVQNSWGEQWGQGGFGVLPYADWLENAMDCWVVQLGVVTAEHEKVAAASSLRVEDGHVALARDPVLADHEIAPFVINTENNGRLSQRGRFYTREEDMVRLLDHHLREACERWNVRDTVDVAVYAHGGLTDEAAAAATARAWIPMLYSQKIFPIFLMWETGGFKTVCNIFEDAVRGETEKTQGKRWDAVLDKLDEWRNKRLEGLARLPGGQMWKDMKQNASALTDHDGAVSRLFEIFGEVTRANPLPRTRLHLIGHSAGGIVHAHLGARALKVGLDVASISLMAPAVRMDVFDAALGEAIAKRRIPVLISHLTDAAERGDGTCAPYGHSLLYLVSRAFEEREETALLGMERYLTAALPTHAWGEHVRRLRTPGDVGTDGLSATAATTHGGVDDDAVVRAAVMRFIHGATGDKPVQRAQARTAAARSTTARKAKPRPVARAAAASRAKKAAAKTGGAKKSTHAPAANRKAAARTVTRRAAPRAGAPVAARNKAVPPGVTRH